MVHFLSIAGRSVRGRYLGAFVAASAVILLLAYRVAGSSSETESWSSQQRATDHATSWQALQPSQREALMPLGRDWQTLDASSRERWVRTAVLLQKKSAVERARAQERLVEWAGLSSASRTVARLHFASVRQIPVEKRKREWVRFVERSKKPAVKLKNAETYVPVAPSVVRVKPGATTVLLDRITAHSKDPQVP